MLGTVGTYEVYKSYEKEFLSKASPVAIKMYRNIKNDKALGPTDAYMDSIFTRFSFDSTYNAASWWNVSDKGTNELRNLQKYIRDNVNEKLNQIYQKEVESQNSTMTVLLLAIIFVLLLIAYTIHSISYTLRELKIAAQKIARGNTNLNVQPYSNDVIGDLANSISQIDYTNKQLADAATAIGKGNFNVPVLPRSQEDLLGNAILKMKNELQQYSERMELLVQDRTEALHRSNEDLQQFAHVASHDLKEPLRKIRIFTDRLLNEPDASLSDVSKTYLQKIQMASERLSNMVEGVLNYSLLNANDQPLEVVDLNKVINDITNDLEILIQQKKAVINYQLLPEIKGIPVLIQQLFYNLINNALKFTNHQVSPVITITYQKPTQEQLHSKKIFGSKQFVEIIVSDNGIGFDQQFSEQMFQVFTRLNTKQTYEGTGLGLALCKKIVQRHNGVIYAEGKPGQGASFHILLPG